MRKPRGIVSRSGPDQGKWSVHTCYQRANTPTEGSRCTQVEWGMSSPSRQSGSGGRLWRWDLDGPSVLLWSKERWRGSCRKRITLTLTLQRHEEIPECGNYRNLFGTTLEKVPFPGRRLPSAEGGRRSQDARTVTAWIAWVTQRLDCLPDPVTAWIAFRDSLQVPDHLWIARWLVKR